MGAPHASGNLLYALVAHISRLRIARKFLRFSPATPTK